METTSTAPTGYDTKPDYYFEWARPEMVPLVPPDCRRVLDVGCATGAFGALLKQSRKIEIWGIEPVQSAAAKASARLDYVINGPFEPGTKLPLGTFDCIVFNDVLEHLVAPEQALRYAKVLLSRGGVIVASIPNIRYLGVLWRLVLQGRWEYEESGVLDMTHLRFFTRSSIVKMFESEGYSVESISGINTYGSPPGAGGRLRRAHQLTNALFLGKFTDMKFPQFAVVAKVMLPE